MKEKIEFQKHYGLSFNDTTRAQRKEIHELLEKRGFNTALTTKKRNNAYINTPGVWDSHFGFEFERMQWRAVSLHGPHSMSFTFKPYKWWKDQLAYVIDNSDSCTGTILDEQIKNLQV